MSSPRPSNLVLTAAAAFCTYFCMYAFRKPFSAGVFADQALLGVGLKSVLIISQGAGYMVSKFVGIKVISEMPVRRRALWLIGLILFAELALCGFAWAPLSIKPCMLFLNGLPLGMVFGLVLAYLEGRRQTEALSAVLCASFISASGVMKSIGRWTIEHGGIDEYRMPMVVGLLFLPPFLVAVWLLQRTPAPGADDLSDRHSRETMSARDRRAFWSAYWPGLTLLVIVYVFLTVLRTIRDDFGVEIWRGMGVEKPAVFAQSELLIALLVVSLNGLVIWIRRHVTALQVTFALMMASFGLVLLSVMLRRSGGAGPFGFMLACGIGLYIPYVAFHTTVFERLIAASRRPCNLGFLMYVADSIGYLGYSVVLVTRELNQVVPEVLPFFQGALLVLSAASLIAMFAATAYFQRALGVERVKAEFDEAPA